jgi:hypothetical protein
MWLKQGTTLVVPDKQFNTQGFSPWAGRLHSPFRHWKHKA